MTGRRLVSLFVSVAILFALIYVVGRSSLIDAVRSVDLRTLSAAAAVGLLAQCFAAWRLQGVARVFGRYLRLREAVRIHFRGLVLNQLLPTGLGGDVYRVYALRNRMGNRRALRAVVADRVLGVVLLLVACVLGGAAALAVNHSQRLLSALTLGALVVLLAMPWALRIMIHAAKLRRVVPRFAGLLAVDVGRTMRRSLGSRDLVWASLAFIGTSIFSYVLTALAVGVPMSLLQIACTAPLIFLLMQFPISFGGWGPREAVTVLLYSAQGVPAQLGFVCGAAFGVVLSLSALPGVLPARNRVEP